MFKKLAIVVAAIGVTLTQAVSAAACGGLIAPNGAIRLQRATTLVAWHDGVEHYMTSFSYQGTGFSDFGWIVPLPTVPDAVEEGGGWTLQRLNRETHPQPKEFLTTGLVANSASADVLMTTQVRALDITVLRGTGDEVKQWSKDNGFYLSPETAAHLGVYAKGSPIFMAAKYNVDRAQETGQRRGDGAPVLITMHTPRPWVPLEVLANGTSEVAADLYLLTDNPLYTGDLAAVLGESPEGSFVPGAPGFAVKYQKRIDDQLFQDLSSDKNMGWVQPRSVLTYMTLNAPATTVTYDMGVSDSGVIHLAAYGGHPMDVGLGVRDMKPVPAPPGTTQPQAFLGPGERTALLGLVALGLAASVALFTVRRRRQGGATYNPTDGPAPG
ncbi:MAG: hypothetical protein QOE92_617 [Chloroflexota bacterium]|jgi:hypothetical protein|nr:hypothetical protein [Chloroflexota bacterium]